MAVLRIVRFKTEPDLAEEMLQTRAELIAATRERFPGLTETRLARVDDATWIDHWRWESADHMQAALDNVTTIPGAGKAFSLISDPQPEVVTIVAESVSAA
jgi:quinol monooxygenase YgiN